MDRSRDVAIHIVSYDELGFGPKLATEFVRGRFSVDKINAHRVRAYDCLSNDQVLSLVRSHVRPSGLTSGFGGSIAITDGLIHQQDIRRPSTSHAASRPSA